MRRTEKEVTRDSEIEAIIQKGQVCHVAFSHNDMPYIIPLYYGYRNKCLYFHAALEGKKIDMIKKNDRVCFEIDIQSEIFNTGVPCNWKNSYQSVIGFGIASLVEDYNAKKDALNILIDHYAPGTNYDFKEKNVNNTAVIKIEILEMTGKQST
jgi:nitroimidazol reductase NimA-like FMN-containing flavoprotein (pyridoxamine 5'-phosphate oxidase superfamily)